MKTPSIRPLLCLASICLFPAAVRAAPLGPFELRASAGVEVDTNVLRKPGDSGQSDLLAIGSLGVKADKEYGLQRIRLDAETTHYRYRDLTYLNYSTLNYSAAWDWRLTPRLQGVISATRRQFRDVTDSAEFNDIDRRTERTELIEGKYEIDGSWRALAGLTRSSNRSTERRSLDASNTVRSARIGASYEPGSGRVATVRLRRGQGEYTDSTSTLTGGLDFDETEVDVLVVYPLTAKTTLDGRLGYLDRRHPDSPSRDFSGPVGTATVTWDFSEKTRFTTGFVRDLGGYQVPGGTYVQSTRGFFTHTYKPTISTAIYLRLERDLRNWRGAPTTPDAGRRDFTQWASATAEWAVQRTVTLSGTVRAERRSSNFPMQRYRSAGIGGAVKVSF